MKSLNITCQNRQVMGFVIFQLGTVFTKGLSQVLGLTVIGKHNQLKTNISLRAFMNMAPGNYLMVRCSSMQIPIKITNINKKIIHQVEYLHTGQTNLILNIIYMYLAGANYYGYIFSSLQK